MTDRVQALTVILSQDIRSDDVQCIVDAIRLLRGVAKVETHVVPGLEHLTRAVVTARLHGELMDAIRGVLSPGRSAS